MNHCISNNTFFVRQYILLISITNIFFYFCDLEEFEAQAEARKNRNNKFTKENEMNNRDKDITTVNFHDGATTV